MAEQRALDAERADFEAWALKCGFKPTTFSHRVGASYLNQYLEDYWTCWQAARRSPVADAAGELPVLMPLPDGEYSRKQVEQIRQDAILADRRARAKRVISINENVAFQAALVDLMCAAKAGLSVTGQSEKVQALTDIIDAQLARQSAPEGAPVAWSYEILQTVEPEIWCEFINRDKPTLGPKWLRNVQPLYATAAPTSASAQPADQNKMENNDE